MFKVALITFSLLSSISFAQNNNFRLLPIDPVPGGGGDWVGPQIVPRNNVDQARNLNVVVGRRDMPFTESQLREAEQNKRNLEAKANNNPNAKSNVFFILRPF